MVAFAETVNYDLKLVANTELQINIPILNIADDWTWSSPLYESGVQPISKKCITLP